MDTIVYKMRQSLFAILILSTLCLQTHASHYTEVVQGQLCDDRFFYQTSYIDTRLGSAQPFTTQDERDETCATLVDEIITNTQAAITSGNVQRVYEGSNSQCDQNACDENEIVNYGAYEFASATSGCLVCISGTKSPAASYTIMKAELGPLPDFYQVSDPETSPKADSVWETQDVDCGDGQFVSLESDGSFKCVGCDQNNFYSEYSVARTSGTGVKHGKCCINGHHKVCQQLLNSYKTKCDDDDADKGHAANRECSA